MRSTECHSISTLFSLQDEDGVADVNHTRSVTTQVSAETRGVTFRPNHPKPEHTQQPFHRVRLVHCIIRSSLIIITIDNEEIVFVTVCLRVRARVRIQDSWKILLLFSLSQKWQYVYNLRSIFNFGTQNAAEVLSAKVLDASV